jgi:hypothetical protein
MYDELKNFKYKYGLLDRPCEMNNLNKQNNNNNNNNIIDTILNIVFTFTHNFATY